MYYAITTTERPLDPAETNIAIQGIKDYISVGKTYKIKPGRRKRAVEKEYKVLWKDSIKFIGESKNGIRETFLYQDIFCGDIILR